MPSPENAELIDEFLGVAAAARSKPASEVADLLDNLWSHETQPGPIAIERIERGEVSTTELLPAHASPERHVIIVGGAYLLTDGSHANLPFAGHLARAVGSRVEVVSYHSAIDAPFPAAINDVDHAISTALASIAQNVFVTIVAADIGALLAIHALLQIQVTHERQADLLILLSPWLDPHPPDNDHLAAIRALGHNEWGAEDDFSILDEDWGRLCPTRIFCSTFDGTLEVANQIDARCGIEDIDCAITASDGLAPQWASFPSLREAQTTIADIAHIVAKHSRPGPRNEG